MAKEPNIQPRFMGARFDEHPLTSAIFELNGLENGWLEGHGIAPDSQNLARLSEKLIESFPVGIDYPAVIPMEDGNVSLEWIKPTARIELEVNFAENRLELHASDIETDTFVDESFGIEDWAGAFQRIGSLLATPIKSCKTGCRR